jgi:hypothetical protein
MKFQRIGGLQLTKQKGYDASMPGFHSPPVRKGVYAFPWPYFEWFLLGASSYSGVKTKHAKFEYIKDENGEKIHYNVYDKELLSKVKDGKMTQKDYDKMSYAYWTDDDNYMIKPKQIRIFEYSNEIWHHLGEHAKPGQILQEVGGWYLSHVDDYKIMLKKEEHQMMKHDIKWRKPYFDKEGVQFTFPNKPSNSSYDHLEVFISNKI